MALAMRPPPLFFPSSPLKNESCLNIACLSCAHLIGHPELLSICHFYASYIDPLIFSINDYNNLHSGLEGFHI